MKKKLLLFAAVLVVGVLTHQNCGTDGFKALSNLSEKKNLFVPNQATSALFAISNVLVNRKPEIQELQMASQNMTNYERVIRNYLESPRFRDAMVEEHQNYFGLGGTSAGSTVDYNLPARIGASLIVNNRNYQEILTSNHCVDQNFNSQDTCDDTFTDAGTAANNAAGVITTRAFLTKHKGLQTIKGYNFGAVVAVSRMFLCSGYPDSKDPGMSAEEISDAVNPWSSDRTCYACHKSLNPRAAMFYYFNREGHFDPNPFNNTSVRDTLALSPPTDVINAGRPIRVLGRSVRSMKDYGAIISEDRRFADCMTLRYYNFLTGFNYLAMPVELESVAESFRKSNYNVKELFVDLLKSSKFLKK